MLSVRSVGFAALVVFGISSGCGESKNDASTANNVVTSGTLSSASAVPTTTEKSATTAEGSVIAFYAVDDEQDYFEPFLKEPPSNEVEVNREGGSYFPGSGVRTFVMVRAGAGEGARREQIAKKLAALAPAGRTLGWQPVYQRAPDSDVLKRTGARSYVLADRFMTERDVARAELQKPEREGERIAVQLTFTQEGTGTFETWTRKLIKRRMAIVSNGEVQSVPVVMDAIAGGTAIITMGGSDEEATASATELVGKIAASKR
ncbi:MAG: hypothetical protein HOW73_03650 [Polyangiaceae bacterium]|nr:hypothetical protein [Polyangiaceae bacterium]